jgi:uncharacterized membrane protein YraQ (UPF0718 family)
MHDRLNIILALLAFSLAGFAWLQGGLSLVLEGAVAAGKTILSVLPLLIAAFLVAGLLQALITRDVVTNWLGVRSGWRGIFLAGLGGALTPGGPYAYYPIAAALLESGASLGVLVTYLAAKNLWSLTRFPFEISLLGPYLTSVRILVTFVIPPLLGILAEMLFGEHIDRIRGDKVL